MLEDIHLGSLCRYICNTSFKISFTQMPRKKPMEPDLESVERPPKRPKTSEEGQVEAVIIKYSSITKRQDRNGGFVSNSKEQEDGQTKITISRIDIQNLLPRPAQPADEDLGTPSYEAIPAVKAYHPKAEKWDAQRDRNLSQALLLTMDWIPKSATVSNFLIKRKERRHQKFISFTVIYNVENGQERPSAVFFNPMKLEVREEHPSMSLGTMGGLFHIPGDATLVDLDKIIPETQFVTKIQGFMENVTAAESQYEADIIKRFKKSVGYELLENFIRTLHLRMKWDGNGYVRNKYDKDMTAEHLVEDYLLKTSKYSTDQCYHQ